MQQRKFKKFFKKSYTNTVKGNSNNIDPKIYHLRKPSKTNIQEELLHPNTAVRNRQQESLSLQTKHQPMEIKKLKI